MGCQLKAIICQIGLRRMYCEFGVRSEGVGGGMTNREFREVLEDRTARYAVDVFKFLRSLSCDVSVKIISYRLGKSASSIGANYHEANRAESRDDFVHKISIALKEANESLYWFKVVKGHLGIRCFV